MWNAEHSRRHSGLLTASIALVGVAGVVGLTGFALGTIAASSRIRAHVRRMEVPPTQLLRRQLADAGTAIGAGMQAWRITPTHSANGSAEVPQPRASTLAAR